MLNGCECDATRQLTGTAYSCIVNARVSESQFEIFLIHLGQRIAAVECVSMPPNVHRTSIGQTLINQDQDRQRWKKGNVTHSLAVVLGTTLCRYSVVIHWCVLVRYKKQP